ncbi:MAG: HEAT repeat domain-containing protein [Nitrosopumilus sp.]|nr:HEAT repeat domain-containing protein [Nitrosopumilus sp.]MDH3384588.1 HEAT repeat domain-containing protein [Nitrosopumilus sp.]
MEILESGTSEEKIKILETFDCTNDPKIVKKIINCLDDPDIKVRGEAFSSLVLNKNTISNFLIDGLKDSRKNIRGFGALVLANRNDTFSIPQIIDLLKDERSMVRSCALGALGHLRAKEAKNIIRNYILDSNIEVRKSALQALINLDEKISDDEIFEISKEKDDELDQLIVKIKKSGPEGI